MTAPANTIVSGTAVPSTGFTTGTQPNTAPPTPPAQQQPGEKSQQPEDPQGAGSKEAILADLARERDRRQAAEAQVQQYVEAGKTAEQKQADKITASETRAVTAETTILRYEVCDAEGLALAAAKFLTGTTKADIEASAKELKQLGIGAALAAQTAQTGLPSAPNASQQEQKPPAGAAGAAEVAKRFAKKQPV